MDFQEKGDIVENKDYIIYLKRKIGSGAFGSVYDCDMKAQDSQKEPLCAKIVSVDNRNKQQVEREDEIMQILKQENNENLVKIYFIRYQENDQKLIVIMEKCKYSLQDEIQKQKKFNDFELQDFFTQLFKGYYSLWKNNIIHRDLKPENILIKETFGRIVYKITDFGTGKKYFQNSCFITNAGTPAYCAPECNILVSDDNLKQSLEKMQMENKIQNYQSQADIFSIGLIAYQLILNEFPIKDAETAMIFFKELKEKKFQPKFNFQRTSTNLHTNLIFKAIVYLPEERITFKQIFDTYLNNNKTDNLFKGKVIPKNLILQQPPQNLIYQQNQNQNNQFQVPNCNQQQFGQPNTPFQSPFQQPAFQQQNLNPQFPAQNPNPQFPGLNPNPQFPAQNPNPQFPAQNPNPQFPAQNPNPQFPAQNPNPQFPAQNPNPQFPAQNQAPQFPAQNQIPLFPAQNQAPLFPAQNQIPLFPAQNQAPQFPAQNQAPQFPAQNQAPQFPAQNPNPQFPAQNPNPQFPAQNPNPQFPAQNQKFPDNTPKNQNQNQQFQLQVPNQGLQLQITNQNQQIFQTFIDQNNNFNNQQQQFDQKDQVQDQKQFYTQKNLLQNIYIDFSYDSTTYLQQELNQNKYFLSSEVQVYFKKLIQQFQDKSFKNLDKTFKKLLKKFEFNQDCNYSLNYLKFYFVLVYSNLNKNVKWDRQTFVNENELKQKIIEIQRNI